MIHIYDQTVEYILENQENFYRLAYSYVNDRDTALDVVQNAVCKILENCTGLRNAKAIRTWCYRIIVNEALQHIRQYRKETICDPHEMAEPIYEEPAFEESKEVYDKVQRLPEKLRTVIILRFYEELTLREIAEVTKENINTVKSRVYKGLSELEKSMKENIV